MKVTVTIEGTICAATEKIAAELVVPDAWKPPYTELIKAVGTTRTLADILIERFGEDAKRAFPSALHPQEFLNAERICDYLLQNRAIAFQVSGESWDRKTVVHNLTERQAIIAVKKMLLDEGERALHAADPSTL